MTLIQIMDGGKAKELFERLAETGAGAAKTRERLMGELKDELQVIAEIEEKHLFPLLRKYKETKDLVQEAIADNRRTRSLLSELERLPKDSDDFGGKLVELRRAFQQHVRDERKELLPAVRKVLSSEEAQDIAAKMAEARSAIEEGRREEQREQRQRQANAEQMRRLASEAPKAASRLARTGAEAAGEGARVLGRAAEEGFGRMRPMLEGMQGLGRLPEVANEALDETRQVMRDFSERASETSRRASSELLRCGSPIQAVEVQGRFVADMAEAWMEAGRRMTEISVRVSQSALSGFGQGERD